MIGTLYAMIRVGRICCILLIIAAAALLPAYAFLTSSSLQSSLFHNHNGDGGKLQMIGKVFGGGDSNEPQLPKDVKDAISKCRGAVQKGLEDRISRMVCGMCKTYII